MSDLIRHIIAHGRVQGVGYRAFVADEAARLGIAGWVRNRRDGNVEAVLSGPSEAVAALIEGCRKGPWGARVDRIDQRDATLDDLALRSGEVFAVLPTA